MGCGVAQPKACWPWESNTMKYLAAFVLALFLAACVSPYGNEVSRQAQKFTKQQENSIMYAVAYNLIDPSSAIFRNIRGGIITYDTGIKRIIACGEVNGRNRFGGYTGFQTFHGDFRSDGSFDVVNIDGYNNNSSFFACYQP